MHFPGVELHILDCRSCSQVTALTDVSWRVKLVEREAVVLTATAASSGASKQNRKENLSSTHHANCLIDGLHLPADLTALTETLVFSYGCYAFCIDV